MAKTKRKSSALSSSNHKIYKKMCSNKPNQTDTKTTTSTTAKLTSEKELLKKCIIGLGGDEEDLELLADVLSDSDVEDWNQIEKDKASKTVSSEELQNSKSLEKEIQSFLTKEFGSFNPTAQGIREEFETESISTTTMNKPKKGLTTLHVQVNDH